MVDKKPWLEKWGIEVDPYKYEAEFRERERQNEDIRKANDLKKHAEAKAKLRESIKKWVKDGKTEFEREEAELRAKYGGHHEDYLDDMDLEEDADVKKPSPKSDKPKKERVLIEEEL